MKQLGMTLVGSVTHHNVDPRGWNRPGNAQGLVIELSTGERIDVLAEYRGNSRDILAGDPHPRTPVEHFLGGDAIMEGSKVFIWLALPLSPAMLDPDDVARCIAGEVIDALDQSRRAAPRATPEQIVEFHSWWHGFIGRCS